MSEFRNRSAQNIPGRSFAAAVIGVVIVLSAVSLFQFPEPHSDEAMLANVTWNLFHNGRFSLDMLGQLNDFNVVNAGTARLYHVVQGAVLAPLRYTFASVRLHAWLGWLLAIAMTFRVGARLFGGAGGWYSALVFSLSSRVFVSGHLGRQEIWLIAVYLIWLEAYLVIRRRPDSARYLLLGLTTIFPVEQHLNGIWLVLPVAIFILWENVVVRSGWRYILAFSAGTAVAAGATAMLHLLPDPALAIAQLAPGSAAYGDLWSASLVRRILGLGENFVYGSLVGYRSVPLIMAAAPAMFVATLYTVTAFVLLARDGSESSRLVVLLTGIAISSYALGMAHKNPHYVVLWDPFFALAVGGAVHRVVEGRFERLRVLRSPTAILLPLVLVSLGGRAYLTGLTASYDYSRYQADVQAAIPAGEHVMGRAPLWFALHSRNPFTADWYFATMACEGTAEMAQFTPGSILGELGITYVVFNGETDTGWDCPGTVPRDIPAILGQHLEKDCRVVAGIAHPTFPGGGYQENFELTPEAVIYRCAD